MHRDGECVRAAAMGGLRELVQVVEGWKEADSATQPARRVGSAEPPCVRKRYGRSDGQCALGSGPGPAGHVQSPSPPSAFKATEETWARVAQIMAAAPRASPDTVVGDM